MTGGWRFWLPYSTVLSLAGQAVVWEHSMHYHVVEMATSAVTAATLQAKAGVDESISADLAEQAAQNEAQAAALTAESEALTAKAEVDEAAAAADETAVAELEAAAAEEEIAAEAAEVEAAAQTVLGEEETAEATVDAALAARDGAEADVDEVATAACEFIPVLDIVCDIVGGIAAVGLEAAALEEGAKAAAEYAAAVAAAVEADIQSTAAVALQKQAAVDTASAVELEVEAEAEFAKAEAEFAEAEADEVAAEEKEAESVAEEAASEETAAAAVAEEDAAATAFAHSLQSAAVALFDGMVATAVALTAAMYFTVRVLLVTVLPSFTSFCIETIPAARAMPARHVIKHVSHVFHHVLIFGLTLGLLGSAVVRLESLSVRARGGCLLFFGATAASINALLLFALPASLNPDLQGSIFSRIKTFSWQLIRRFILLFPLFVMEILWLRVILGHNALSSCATDGFCQTRSIWFLLAMTIYLHIIFLEVQAYVRQSPAPCVDVSDAAIGMTQQFQGSSLSTHLESDCVDKGPLADNDETADLLPDRQCHTHKPTDYGSSETVVVNCCNPTQEEDDGGSAMETITLLSGEDKNHEETNVSSVGLQSPATSWWTTLQKDMEMLIIPFELLVLTVMVHLLLNCLPHLQPLWNTSKHIIESKYPNWAWFVAAAGVFVVSLLALCIQLSIRREAKPSGHSKLIE